MGDEDNKIIERIVIMETVAHNLVDHIRREEEQFSRIEKKLDKLHEKFDERLSAVEKATNTHSTYFKIIGSVIGSSAFIGVAIGLLLN